MKGIILAGGSGTRLYPITIPFSKQLIPVYDKPMIYYPLSTLMLAGIRDILIITTQRDNELFRILLKDGSQWGINLTYAIQDQPKGIADAFIIGKSFIGNDSICLILGDNIFYSEGFISLLAKCSEIKSGAQIFGYYVKDPQNFGVVEFDKDKNVISLDEKPTNPKSNYAIPGLYFYDNQVVEIAEKLNPSIRGEIEITDINKIYLERHQLRVELLGRGTAWLDTGTHESLIQSSIFIQTLESRQGLKIGCVEEIAYRMDFIDKDKMKTLANLLNKTEYGQYLLRIIED